MPMIRRPVRAVVVIASLLSSACTTVGPDFKSPDVPWLASWSGGALESLKADSRPGVPPQSDQWWHNFNDPALDQLIAEAQRLNPGVRTAGMRIMEARAQLGIAGSALYPQLQQISGEALRVGQNQSGGADNYFSAYSIGLNIGWEIDFWGKFRRGIEA
ncbi:MAG: efflux system, outer rane lipoprotein, NodT family, partial [Proteobacteria bacterium]|nr:efflux system, outer rane lipoprotein, NodT family [Pseudomonadota bacterium]